MSDETEIINNLFKQIKSCSIINFPEYEYPSIKEQILEVSDENRRITFTSDEYYDKDLRILKFRNGQIFEGEIGNKGEKYFLVNGTYKWPSGQIYKGKFKDNLFLSGQLEYEGNTYERNFINGLFGGKGEFKFNSRESVKGNFENGELNGHAHLKRDNIEVVGNFVESKPEGLIDKFILNFEDHIYEFENFNFRVEKIQEEELLFKKDGKKLSYIQKLDNLNKDQNSQEEEIQKEELSLLKNCLHLINIRTPEFEEPNISKEGLIVKEEDYPLIKFKNGEVANIDDDKDENELTLPNGEKFVGRLDLANNYSLKIGKYSWPSGQYYDGTFKNNKFETSIENSKLIRNEWSYKGKFKNGKFDEKCEIDFKDGKKIIAYFTDNKIKGHMKIEYKNIVIEGEVKDSLISDIKIDLNGQIYKIKSLDFNNNKNEFFVITKEINENSSHYFILNYRIINNKIEIEKINRLSNEELGRVLQILNTKIRFPPFELPSINENSLITQDNNKIITFLNKSYYDTEQETLFLPNNETYKGKLENSLDIYYLSDGEYSWPSGQKYIGKFNKDNNFHSEEEKSILTFGDLTYEGKFQNGLPNGEGIIKWQNGDVIKGKFVNGKIYGDVYIKKDNVSFEGNYLYSIIDGYIKNIQIENSEQQLENNQLTVIKGKIEEDEIKFNGKIFKLTDENRNLVSPNDYKKTLFDEEDILLLFKYIYKIRKLNLPSYDQPRISEDGIYIQSINNLQNVELTFPNNEKFNGHVQNKIGNKYMLIEGEYTWPNGQNYKGKFEKNRFCDVSAELNYGNQYNYIGGFKNGLFEGFGKYTHKNDIIEAFFQKGQLNSKIFIQTKNFSFEGDKLDLINELYIKSFKIQTKEHSYEISEFNINKTNITYKRDEIEFKIGISKELKRQIIESLLIRNKSLTKNFYYNNPYMGDLSNENIIRTLKIENNIYSGKLSKLAIYKNRLLDENRTRKKEARKITGDTLFKMMSMKEVDYRLNSMKTLRAKISNNLKLKKSTQHINFGEIEQKEIAKIFNRKMLKEMEKENDLLKQDINTLKMEKELIEKERYNRFREMQDLNLYFDLIDNNYNDLIKEKDKIEEETKGIHQELKLLHKENDLLSKYLKDKSTINNKEEINKNIKESEYNNSRILTEISEKEKKINEQNKEKNELSKQIEKLQNNKNNIK